MFSLQTNRKNKGTQVQEKEVGFFLNYFCRGGGRVVASLGHSRPRPWAVRLCFSSETHGEGPVGAPALRVLAMGPVGGGGDGVAHAPALSWSRNLPKKKSWILLLLVLLSVLCCFVLFCVVLCCLFVVLACLLTCLLACLPACLPACQTGRLSD